ncbi:hypothetical protein GOODEAATRI_019779, partial [Goodea atripinnis]
FIAEFDLRSVQYEVKSSRCHEMRLAASPHDCLRFNFRCDREAEAWSTVMANTTLKWPWIRGTRPPYHSVVSICRYARYASALTACSENVAFFHPFTRGAVFRALQGDRSRRRSGCIPAGVRTGSTESGADDTAVPEKLHRRRN